MNNKKIYHVPGVANAKEELIENLENYQKLFSKFQEVLGTDDNLKSVFKNSINNIEDAKDIILSDKVDIFYINKLLKIIKRHILIQK